MRENVLMKTMATANIKDVKNGILNLIFVRQELRFQINSKWLLERESKRFVSVFAA